MHIIIISLYNISLNLIYWWKDCLSCNKYDDHQ